MNCPFCQTEASLESNFCEECGAKLTLPADESKSESAPASNQDQAACANCGAAADAIDAQGFCEQCGHQRCPPPRDHLEVDGVAGAAGVSDRGTRHFRNEDFLALGEVEGGVALAVCDGVSNSPRADEASAAAAVAIRDALVAGVAASGNHPERVMETAFSKAHAAVDALTGTHGKGGHLSAGLSPATTAVAALVRRPIAGADPATSHEVILGWLGDSRAYFFDQEGGARQLTKDHSLINEMLDAGEITRTAALRSNNVHTVTRTLGGLPAEEGRLDAPSILRVELRGPGWLLLCTDGLWNYAPEASELALWIARLAPSETDPLMLGRALVAEALQLGGRDNITAAVVAL